MIGGQIKSMNPLQWGLLIILSIFWGGSFLFVGIAVEDFQPFTIAFLRVLIASLILWLAIIISSIKIPKIASIWCSFFIMGTINSAIPFSLIAWGQSNIPSGLASILIATTPLITVIGAHFYTTDEKITANKDAKIVHENGSLLVEDVPHNELIEFIEEIQLKEDDLGDKALINQIKTMKENNLPNFKVLVKSINNPNRKLRWAKYKPEKDKEMLKEYNFCGHSINLQKRNFESNGSVATIKLLIGRTRE